MKSFIGQRGRDRVLRVWVESYGRRAPLAGDDVAGRILTELFGARFVEDDFRCYQEFRDQVVAPRLGEASWTLTEAEVREWKDTYRLAVRQPAPDTSPGAPVPMSPSADDGLALISWGNGITRARLVHHTPSVLLLEGQRPSGTPLPAGSPLRIGLPGTTRMVPGRLAAYGQNNRFLVALGSRAVRGAARMRVDLRASVYLPGVPNGLPARLVDLSSSGARVRGHALAVGSDFELSFVPPGRQEVVRVPCAVVRAIPEMSPPEVGVAFCGAALSFRVDLTATARP